MKRFLTAFAIAALCVPQVVSAQGDASVEVDLESKEYKFVACVNEKDQSLLYAMRDAESPEGFQEAAGKAFAMCPMDGADSFSMKKFFDAIASFIGKPTYDDAESQD